MSTIPTAHQICEKARQVPCICGAHEGAGCDCEPGGVHLARIVIARRMDQVTGDDVVAAIRLASQTPWAVLCDPERAA